MDFHCCLIAILSCHLLHTQNAVWSVFLSSLIDSRKPKHPFSPFLFFLHDWKYIIFFKSVIVTSSFYHICIHLSQSVNTWISCQTQCWWEEVMMDLVTECIEPSVCQTCRAMMWVQYFSITRDPDPKFHSTSQIWCGGFHANRDISISSTLYPKTNIQLSSSGVMIWCLCAWVILQLALCLPTNQT